MSDLELGKLLEDLLQYNGQTGDLVWRVDHGNYKQGQIAGRHASGGYELVSVQGSTYPAHRVAWRLHYSVFPIGEIDHINHNKTDNRIANLRDVTSQGNSRNRTIASNNTSGVTGVVWLPIKQKWRAQIMVDYKFKNLGVFETLNEAVIARQKASKKYGFHKNHGIKKNEVKVKENKVLTSKVKALSFVMNTDLVDERGNSEADFYNSTHYDSIEPYRADLVTYCDGAGMSISESVEYITVREANYQQYLNLIIPMIELMKRSVPDYVIPDFEIHVLADLESRNLIAIDISVKEATALEVVKFLEYAQNGTPTVNDTKHVALAYGRIDVYKALK